MLEQALQQQKQRTICLATNLSPSLLIIKLICSLCFRAHSYESNCSSRAVAEDTEPHRVSALLPEASQATQRFPGVHAGHGSGAAHRFVTRANSLDCYRTSGCSRNSVCCICGAVRCYDLRKTTIAVQLTATARICGFGDARSGTQPLRDSCVLSIYSRLVVNTRQRRQGNIFFAADCVVSIPQHPNGFCTVLWGYSRRLLTAKTAASNPMLRLSR